MPGYDGPNSSRSTADAVFEVRTERLAQLTVVRTQGNLGFTVDASSRQRHEVGIRGAPLYEADQPLSPDDSWRIRRRADGAFVDGAPIASAVDEPYRRWAAGSRAARGHELIGHLPPGRYLLVRSARPARRARRVLLGNELIPATPNMRVLRQDEPVAACIVGANSSLPPDLTQPLLGLVVLHLTGATGPDRTDGVIFLQFASFGSHDPGPDRDLVLVIPVDGELVMDNIAFFSTDAGRRCKQDWRERLAADLASWCTDQ